jgi:molecular chaperone GrpE
VTQHGSAKDDAGKVPSASGGTSQRDMEQESEERIVVRDRRRIDPNGTEPRTAATDGPASAGSGAGGSGGGAAPSGSTTEDEAAAGGAAEGAAAETDSLRAELDERTRDLKRVVAEYANYRRRVERDRSLAAEQATGALLAALLPVLDDLDRAREHGDLVGPFAAVADQLVSILTKAGLTPYGEAGDPFDPMHHEAVAHSLSPEVTEPTCVMVMRRGYRHGERMLRPAMVAVADPDPDAESSAGPGAATQEAAGQGTEAGAASADSTGSGSGPEQAAGGDDVAGGDARSQK